MSIRIMLPHKQFQAIYVHIIDGNAIQILDTIRDDRAYSHSRFNFSIDITFDKLKINKKYYEMLYFEISHNQNGRGGSCKSIKDFKEKLLNRLSVFYVI